MCFRPAETGKTVTCKQCGKVINEVPGFTLLECPMCKAPLVRDAEEPAPIAPSAAPAPTAPAAPGAPGAPKSPGK